MVSKKSNMSQYIPIAKPYLDYREEALVSGVLKSCWISQGKKVEEFESRVAEYTGAEYAVAASSGTTALHTALIVSGVGQNDEVIVPSFSFIATANAILYCNARPIFIDIDPGTYNVNPENINKFIEKECKFDLKKRTLFNRQTGACVKAIMPVHQFGLPCDMNEILHIARKFNLAVIEDAACALGSRYKNMMIGSLGNITCFSFHPRKILTTGEGGMLVTNNKRYAQKAKALRNHGLYLNKGARESYPFLGFNYRLTDLQAAMGLAQMEKLREILYKRQAIARYYDEAFKKLSYLQTPHIPAYAVTNYQSYVIQLKDNFLISRDDVIRALTKKGISVRRGNTAIHLQPLYRKRKFKLPNTEKAALNTIALPIFYGMTKKEQDYVIDKITSLGK